MAQNVHLPPYPEPQPQPPPAMPNPGHQAPYPDQPQCPGFKQESNIAAPGTVLTDVGKNFEC